MTKTGIWAIIIATAFIAGTLMANPFAEAAGGWKEALENLTVDWSQLTGIPADIADGDDVGTPTQADIESLGFVTGAHTTDTTLTEAQVDAFANNNGYSTGSHTIDTNAATICPAGRFLNGDGTCDPVPVDTNTNAATICPSGTFLNGDGTCDTISGISCDWSGTRWASSGVDGACAFSSGMHVTCSGGVVTSISYLSGCGTFP